MPPHSNRAADDDRWLSLSEAAGLVGVHFTTLRRWADAGEVPCIRTPGGRRRFRAGDLRLFIEGLRRSTRALVQAPLESRALDMARQKLHDHPAGHPAALGNFGEEQRQRFKGSGQHLLGLLIQYGSRTDGGEIFLEEGRLLAAEYGCACYQAGMSVSDTVRTFLFFGHSMLATVQQAGAGHGPHDEEGPPALPAHERVSGCRAAGHRRELQPQPARGPGRTQRGIIRACLTHT